MSKLRSINTVGLLLAMLAVSCDCTNFQVPSAESDKHAAKLAALIQQIGQLSNTLQSEVQESEKRLLATLKQDVQDAVAPKVQELVDKQADHAALIQQIGQLSNTLQSEVQGSENRLRGELATLRQDVQAAKDAVAQKVQELVDKQADHAALIQQIGQLSNTLQSEVQESEKRLLATLKQDVQDQLAAQQQTLGDLKSALEQAKEMIQANAATPASLQIMVEELRKKVDSLEKRIAKQDAAAEMERLNRKEKDGLMSLLVRKFLGK